MKTKKQSKMKTKRGEDLRYIYLGRAISAGGGKYAILTSDLSPEQVIERNKRGILKEASFAHYATNWGGADDLGRTCKLENIQCFEGPIILENFLTFSGKDPDHGHVYEWSIKIDRIYTVK